LGVSLSEENVSSLVLNKYERQDNEVLSHCFFYSYYCSFIF